MQPAFSVIPPSHRRTHRISKSIVARQYNRGPVANVAKISCPVRGMAIRANLGRHGYELGIARRHSRKHDEMLGAGAASLPLADGQTDAIVKRVGIENLPLTTGQQQAFDGTSVEVLDLHHRHIANDWCSTMNVVALMVRRHDDAGRSLRTHYDPRRLVSDPSIARLGEVDVDRRP